LQNEVKSLTYQLNNLGVPAKRSSNSSNTESDTHLVQKKVENFTKIGPIPKPVIEQGESSNRLDSSKSKNTMSDMMFNHPDNKKKTRQSKIYALEVSPLWQKWPHKTILL